MKELDPRTTRMIEDRVADALASAGWDGDRIATELLYFLPDRFEAAYTQLFHTALRDADAGTNARGQASDDNARLGKATGKPTKGGQIHRKGGAPKKYRNHWHIGDDRALRLKETVDKRLRQLAREIEMALVDLSSMDLGSDLRPTCQACGQFVSKNARYCSSCGSRVNAETDRD